MSLIDYLSGAALFFVILQLWLMGSQHYRTGWWAAVVACFLWAGFSFVTEAWALLAQQGLILGLALRALKKLGWWIKTSGLSRRDMVESKNQKTTASENAYKGDDHDPIIGEIYDHF